MSEKKLPFTKTMINEIIAKYPTPFHIYDEKGIMDNIKALQDAFSWAPSFKEFFAVKAAPNPYLMKILKARNIGTDCSSLPELLLSEKVGIIGENIMFTSNNTPVEEFAYAKKLGAIINLDDITHLDFLEKNVGLPDLLCFRYNPGELKQGNNIIGEPKEAKYGLTREQLKAAYSKAAKKGVKRFGLHTMVASNELNTSYFEETASVLFELVAEISKEYDIIFEFVNLGGGIGIPYRLEDNKADLQVISDGIKRQYEKHIVNNGLNDLKIFLECGRIITGPYGYLVTKVRHIKETYKTFVGLDACMTNLMRPALYGAYHHITILGKEDYPAEKLYDVTGSLCENNDKFAIDRKLPEIEIGDILVIHDTGAHGHAMGFNYNGKLRSAELLLRKDGTVYEIRRAETKEDLFATLDLEGLKDFT